MLHKFLDQQYQEEEVLDEQIEKVDRIEKKRTIHSKKATKTEFHYQ